MWLNTLCSLAQNQHLVRELLTGMINPAQPTVTVRLPSTRLGAGRLAPFNPVMTDLCR